MTKSELVTKLAAAKPRLTRRDAETAVTMILGEIAAARSRGRSRGAAGFGPEPLNGPGSSTILITEHSVTSVRAACSLPSARRNRSRRAARNSRHSRKPGRADQLQSRNPDIRRRHRNLAPRTYSAGRGSPADRRYRARRPDRAWPGDKATRVNRRGGLTGGAIGFLVVARRRCAIG
jgi:hypothetical protein